MSNPLDGAKRFKLLDELFLAFGNGKVIFKDLKKPDKHQTMSFLPNGIIDVHETKEGSKKEYESLGKYDILKGVANLVSNPNDILMGMIKTIQLMKEVNFEESEFEHLKVSPIMTLEELSPFLKISKKKVEIPPQAAENLNFLDNMIPWKQAKDKIKEHALVFGDDKPAGHIFKKNGKFLYLPVADLMETPLMEFFNQALNLEKIEGKFSEKENELRKKLMNELTKDSES